MKKSFSLLIISLVIINTQAQRGKFVQRLIEKRLDKNSAATTGPAPDYGNLFYWAASPHKTDSSDYLPAFLKGKKRIENGVDVFFIHPTSNVKEIKTAAWNADLLDTAINHQTDSRTIKYQASVFNEGCRVYAPRYRQANLKAFFVRETDKAKETFDLAYGDVKNAFDYYLTHENNGRPIIIASHSQGSLHAIRLLQEFFDGKELQQKLVCAYVIGYHIPEDAFRHIPVGESATQTGCVVGWRSYQKGEISQDVKKENGNSICVNPLTWTTSTSFASPDLNSGMMGKYNWNLTPRYAGAEIEPQYKVLWVTLPSDASENIKKMKNLHIYDYNLFWMNIRENVKQRINQYLKIIK